MWNTRRHELTMNTKMYRGLFAIVAISCCLQAAKAASTAQHKNSAIKYPGPIQDLSNRYGTADDDVPEQCKSQNFCTIKPADYPQAEFNAMFKGTKAIPQPTLFIEAFGDRQGDPDINDNCDTRVTYEPLYKVRSTRGEWHTVIQAPEENYIQKVRLETCNEEGSSCFTGVAFGNSVTTYCKQKYSVWQVLVSDGKNNTEKIKAELPICCSCHYKLNNKK